MNTYPGYIAYWKEVAATLTLLGRESGRTNLFFVEMPEEANVLITAIRQKLTLPCLAVEYFDESQSDSSGLFTELTGVFVVLAQAEKRQQGHDHTRAAIYEQAKPAADAIAARMLRQSDRRELTLDGKVVTVLPNFEGNWVGPLHNDLYGWRYAFTWRIGVGLCYDAEVWE